jgi:hypothetical protein
MATAKQIAANRRNAKSPNVGRPPGTRSPATIEKELAARALRDRVLRSQDALINSQMALAKGVTMLYVIKTDRKGNRGRPQVVTDQQTIEQYLAGELDNSPHQYYFLATEKPNNAALDSLLDRAHGKAVQAVELTGKDGEPLFKPSDAEREQAEEALDNVEI